MRIKQATVATPPKTPARSGRSSHKQIAPSDPRPDWMTLGREKRTLASDVAGLRAHLKAVFLGTYEDSTAAKWKMLVAHQLGMGPRYDVADALAKHFAPTPDPDRGFQRWRNPSPITSLSPLPTWAMQKGRYLRGVPMLHEVCSPTPNSSRVHARRRPNWQRLALPFQSI
jgi:hypothetical protein